LHRCIVPVFVPELSPSGETLWFEHALCYGGLDGAAGFVSVGAVPEPTERGKLGDLGE